MKILRSLEYLRSEITYQETYDKKNFMPSNRILQLMPELASKINKTLNYTHRQHEIGSIINKLNRLKNISRYERKSKIYLNIVRELHLNKGVTFNHIKACVLKIQKCFRRFQVSQSIRVRNSNLETA